MPGESQNHYYPEIKKIHHKVITCLIESSREKYRLFKQAYMPEYQILF